MTLVLVMGLAAPAVACEYEDGRAVIELVRLKYGGEPITVGVSSGRGRSLDRMTAMVDELFTLLERGGQN